MKSIKFNSEIYALFHAKSLALIPAIAMQWNKKEIEFTIILFIISINYKVNW